MSETEELKEKVLHALRLCDKSPCCQMCPYKKDEDCWLSMKADLLEIFKNKENEK